MWKPYLCLCIEALLCSKCARDRWYDQAHRSQTWCNNAVASLSRHAGHHRWLYMNSSGHWTDCKLQLACLQTLSVVHLHVKMHDFSAIHTANLVTDMHTNHYKPYQFSSVSSVVQLHVKMHDFYAMHHASLVKDMHTNNYKPYQFSSVQFSQFSSVQLFNCT